MKRIITAAICLIISQHVFSQQTFPRNGVKDEREKLYVFVHANICTDYQTMISDATMVIRDGKIEAIGKDIPVPKGAIVTSLQGKFIYPSFIDMYSDYGMPPVIKNRSQDQRGPQFLTSKNGAYNWNQAVHPEIHSNELFEVKAEQAKELREMGFGTVASHQKDGIIRGTGTIVLLGEEKSNEMVLKDQSAEYYSFNKGVSTQDYPGSLMGSIALVRQTYYDAQWYKSTNGTAEVNISLDALNKAMQLPQVFEVGDVYSAMRADKVGDEFNIKYIVKGAGDEYQRIDDVKATGDAFIIPLNFPVAFDVEDPYDAEQIPLAALMHWEMAPGNPAALEKAGITIAITSAALKSKNDFFKNLRTAIDYGMSPAAALKALTYTPASLMGVLNQVGTLEKGKLANFIICSDTVFKEKNIIYQNWVKGLQYVVNSYDLKDVRGNYTLTAGTLSNLNLQVEGTATTPEATINLNEKDKLKATIKTVDNLVSISFRYPADTSQSVYRLSGYWKEKNLIGTGQDPGGNWINWSAQYAAAYQQKADTSKKKEKPKSDGTVLYPFIGYGNASLPKPENFLFRNATVWTNESEGILQNTDIFISGGKIQKVGKNLPVPQDDVKVYDATGKYLTSGIIDEHSHIAASQGLNEGTQSVTSEVRVGDIITPADINIYRQLSGGVTASHILHGSANSIGGQTQLIKLRWGYSPEAMKFQGWPGFIKFALGENVKQSNWGDQNTKRFPQTRMGVEQTMYDAFIRAKDYKASWSRYNSIPAKQKATAIAPRRDLELDALVEILDGKRFITCHSYVQSEVNMLMHVGDSMGFKVNTFTHILEGYKVADKMKARNIYASNFSDWWAYKYEVYDAIPYNSAILNRVGVITAVNSDDAEMARRLNQEAAKSIKYGGLSEEEAWKLCTLNPAKMLHIDDKVGSIKVGKDADVVLWNNNPLSIYASPEMTLVDGTCFFSLEKDAQHQQWMQQERARLINKMLQAKKEGVPTQKIKIEFNREWDCESMTDGSKVGN
ncbi:MAG: amidohydrolase family protein [Chitinophagales bacterium]